MIPVKRWAGAALLALIVAGCESTPDPEIPIEQGPARQELAQIRDLYEPPACYLADFNISIWAAGHGAQNGRGTIRADNANERMLIAFRDPFIGLELSRVVIRDGMVYIKDTNRGVMAPIPLEQFYVSGLGNNSIRLPFSVFQDLLYSRIPDQLFDRQTDVRQEENRLVASWEQSIASYRYQFENRRLRAVEYDSGPYGEIDADLTGSFGETVYPQAIQLEAGQGGRVSERFNLEFRSIDPNANCGEAYFVPPR